MISHKAPRVTGPTANRSGEGVPPGADSAPQVAQSTPSPNGAGRRQAVGQHLLDQRLVAARMVAGQRRCSRSPAAPTICCSAALLLWPPANAQAARRTGSIAAIRPAWVLDRAGSCAGRSAWPRPAAPCGGDGCPTMAGHGGRSAPCRPGSSSAQSVCACGRTASITARQPTALAPARRTSRRTARNSASRERRSPARELELLPRRGGRMAERQQAAARDRVDRPLEALLGEGEADIDHGQPGAEHDHRAPRLQRRRRLRRPGIVDVAGRAAPWPRAGCPAPARRHRPGRCGRCRSRAGSRRWRGGSRSPRR